MLVFGGGIVINEGPLIAYITLKKKENTLIIIVVAIVCTYVSGIGLSIWLAVHKIKRLSWKNKIVQHQRENLRIESEAFRSELNISSAGAGAEVGSSSGVSNVSVASSSSGVTIESANTCINACIDSLGSDYFYHGHIFYVIAIGAIGAIFLGVIVILMVFSDTEEKDPGFAVKLGQAYFSHLTWLEDIFWNHLNI